MLYYLQNRYYNAPLGRFVNVDSQISNEEINLYAYCVNDTINNYDPLGGSKIMIDPGHGGTEYGSKACSFSYKVIIGVLMLPRLVMNTYYEKDFNLRVALILQRLLLMCGYNIYMIRTTDETVRNERRAELANLKNVDCYVSIHHNSSNIFKKGYTVLYAGKHDENISKKLAYSISNSFARNTSLNKYSSPTKSTDLKVLNLTKMPAVLVECGYMGGDLIYCRDNPDKIAYAIFQGIKNTYKPINNFSRDFNNI